MVDFSIFAPVLGVEGRVSLLLHFAQLDFLPGLWCCENAGVEDPSYSKCSSNDGTYLELQREETHLSTMRETFTQLELEEGSCCWGVCWKHSKNWGWNSTRIIHKNHSQQWNKLVLNSSQPEPITNPSSHSTKTAWTTPTSAFWKLCVAHIFLSCFLL